MTERLAARSRDIVDLSTVLPWRNMSGETVPAYGVVQVRTDYTDMTNISKPDSGTGLFFVNGHVPVPDAKYGESYMWGVPHPVLLDADVEVGDEVGPAEDSWSMVSDGTGWRVLRKPVDGVGIVVMVGGGGAGTHEILFEIVSVACDSYTDAITLTVRVLYYTGGCLTKIPGADPYTGYVEVEDFCSMLTFYTVPWLESGGVKGRATYFWPREEEDCVPVWKVDTICGTPECTDGT